MKKNKFIKISIVFAILLYTMLILANDSFAGTLSSDINGINEGKYPGVKSLIQNLQKKHGNYKFQVYYTGIDWTEAVTMEYQGHGGTPKNLFSVSNSYKGKWYCPICGSKTYDTGWYCASIDAIKYMMDPRNSLDETSVFQFKNLESSDVSANHIASVINSKYASYSYINNSTMINAIVNASAKCNLNGYSILAKIVNEQGRGSSPLATGSGYNGQYTGYYNFFNVGAYGNGISNVITNGLKYAQNKGWNSVEKSVLGGSEYYKSQYIGRGQNTLHYQRFNVIYTPSLFSHQYQQDVMGAQTSATLLKSYYTTSGTISSINHTFVIPLYENMPSVACSRPSTTQNSTLNYEEATVTTNRLAVKASPNSGRIVSYLNANEKIKVLERASRPSADGNYWDVIVTNTDGTYGYVARSGIAITGTASGNISITNNFPRYIFDAKYYADQYKDLKNAFGYNESALFNHFVNYGMAEGRSASPVFNAKYYFQTYGDLRAAYGNNYLELCNHFINFGCNEYRKSSTEYDGQFYKYYYSDLTSFNGVQLADHYVNYGRAEGRLAYLGAEMESILFDASVYAECNSDLRAVFGNNAQELKKHWLTYGIREGRTASLLYSSEIYSLLSDDLQRAYGGNHEELFKHFIRNGINENRQTSLFFYITRYTDLNADVKNAFKNDRKQIYLHFKNFGISEGRDASDLFNTKTYINSNSDLKAAFGTNYKAACIHFLQFGIKEKRKTSSNFDCVAYARNYQDLQRAFGNNNREYYYHYLRYGRKEGRKGI